MEDLKIEKLLGMFEKYPDLTPLQRAVLSSTGTVQSLLSAVFEKPVIAKIISQLDAGDTYIRWVILSYEVVSKKVGLYNPESNEIGTQLVPEIKEVTVCLAESVFPHSTNDEKFLNALRKGKDGGIGQVLAKMDISTTREILGIFCDENVFSRTYRLIGDRVDAVITEVFSNNEFKDL